MAYSPSSLTSGSDLTIADGDEVILRGSKRLRGNSSINSSRALGKKSKLGSSREEKVKTDKVVKHNLCFFCKSGGYIRTCDKCSEFAACFLNEGVQGCLPNWALTAKEFICPNCYELECVSPPYTLPSRMSAFYKTGLNTDPLILYSVFLEEGSHFRVAGTFVEGLMDGYYRAKESYLLSLVFPYRNLGTKEAMASSTKNQALMTTFLSKFPRARFILQLQTHASPTDGGLLYAENRSVGLSELLDHLIGKVDLGQCSKTLLLLNACGGFIKHQPLALQECGNRYRLQTLVCLRGEKVDPLVIARTLFCTFVDSHVIVNETVVKALERCVGGDLLVMTSVQVWTNGITLTLEGASMGRRPNGTDENCRSCGGRGTLYKNKSGIKPQFRCMNAGHAEGPKMWSVTLDTANNRTKIVEGPYRSIIRSSKPFFE